MERMVRGTYSRYSTAAHRGHEPEGPQILNVALESHQVEVVPKLVRVVIETAAQTDDHVADQPLFEIERGVAQERRRIVGIRPHPAVLKIDETEGTVPDHQVPRLQVAVAVHPRQAVALPG